MTTQTHTFTPNWLYKIFGAKSGELYFSDDKLFIKLESSDHYEIDLRNISNAAAFHSEFLFSSLHLDTNRGPLHIKGLNKTDAQGTYDWLRQHWILQLTPLINKNCHQIESIIARGYLRSSRLDSIRLLANEAVSKFKTVPNETWSSHIDLKNFQYVYDISQWNTIHIEQLKNEYVSNCKTKYKNYFDNIESNPLTDLQRNACIIDEDNNLVLAGAGTGKTSTMVGRAGFLIKSNQAKPNNILMLAFGKKASTEMQERIEERLGNIGITASTFHGLGKQIIAQVEGAQPSLTPLAEDDKKLAWHVNEWFEKHLTDDNYKKIAIHYFQYHLYPEANPFDFKSEGEYFDYIRANDIVTLKGEAVKSLGECLVANYLFKNGIEYQYEAKYEHVTRDMTFRQYQPDFYLPEHGIYLEYFGIDKEGKTAPYVNQEKYHEGMTWKRELHKKNNTKLIKAFHYQLVDGSLFKKLDQSLLKANVTLHPLPADAILDTLREFGAISSFASLLTDLLKRYRANCYEDGQLESSIESTKNPDQVKAALDLLLPIVDDYTTLLKTEEDIDFDDMIGKAINYVRTNRFKSPWNYILVDEFQDISDPRARLIRHLQNSVNKCSIFCVGDDWQAIYRFTGSDIKFTTDFESIFGTTKVTPLDLTFRFNNRISDVASRFVLENPEQVKKELKTFSTTKKNTVSLLREDNRRSFGNNDLDERLITILKRIETFADKGSSVYILGRYGFNLPSSSQLRELRSQVPSLYVNSFTIHSSKGKEADYIVLLGLEKGKHGFPSQKVTNPLLDALLPTLEKFPYSEERRLFYVAMTRARHRVYLVTDMAVTSEFIIELLDNKYPIELDEFNTSLSQKLFQLIHCVKCTTGILVARKGKNGSFFGCNNYPLCNHTENGCSSCSTTMQRIGRFKACLNPDCDTQVPICPKCGAEMTQREGRKGKFWGCRNYRSGDEVTCKHTENHIEFGTDMEIKGSV